MENMQLYDSFRKVPGSACKTIEAGRLKGKTDINPMWRIKVLTERFGPCGIGWKYEVVRFWAEEGANGEKAAFAEIRLYIKADGQWSDPIPGIGGSALVAKEKNGLYTSDECYKMALTDAISVSCKALGVGADIYWSQDATKYGKKPDPDKLAGGKAVCPICGKPVQAYKTPTKTWTPEELIARYGKCSVCVKKESHEKQTTCVKSDEK